MTPTRSPKRPACRKGPPHRHRRPPDRLGAELPARSPVVVELREMGLALGFGTVANDWLEGTANADELHGAGGDYELLGNA